MNVRSKLYRASAGTGKTHQLTSHYLRLVCGGARHDRIVASTFTRKAAGEILARVLARLARAATSDEHAQDLDGQLGLQLGRAGYLARLEQLARRIDGFRISTLDAFFVLVAQALAGELGLPPDWSIADEVDLRRARDGAVADALASLDRDQWGVLLRELERGSASRGVHSTLVGTIELASSLFAESDASAWDRLSTSAGVSETELKGLAACLDQLPFPLTTKGKAVSKYVDAVASLRELVGRPEFHTWSRSPEGLAAIREYFRAGVGAKIRDGEAKFASCEIPREWFDFHAVLLRLLAAEELETIVAHNRAARRLLEIYARSHIERRERTGRLGFDEIARALAEHASGAQDSLSVALDERLDARIDHLLLDEFQDTAPSQWRVLRRVSEELVQEPDGSRTFFCVGDTKQSIYGWRAGEPRLLERMHERLQPLDLEQLNVSYRSSQVILDAANRIFLPAVPFAGFAGHEGYARALRTFHSGYVRHEARRALPGVFRVHTATSPEKHTDRPLHCMLRAVEIVAQVRALAPQATIAVLLRRNKFAALLLSKLRELDIPASGEGGNPLVDAISVQAACAALHWLEHPADAVAHYHAATSALGPALGLAPELGPAACESVHRELRHSLAREGLASWLANLRGAIAGALGTWEQRRFGMLVELALSQEPAIGIDEFLERVRSVRVEDSSSATVKVMTVHASKGLEFDAVVLPELDVLWKQDANAFYWRREGDDPEARIDLVSRHVSDPTRRALALAGQSEIVELNALAEERDMRDQLSVLYVALTRARYRLDLVIPPVGNKDGDPRCSAAALVRERLELGHGVLDASSTVFEAGDTEDGWVRQLKERAAIPAPAPPKLTTLAFAPSVRRRELERRSPSELGHDETVKTEKLFESVGNTPSQRRGSRFHRWFEELEWLEDFARTDEELRALALEVDRDAEGLEKDIADFRATLCKPNFRQRFSKPSEKVEVWRERRFRRPVGDALQSGSFDRVVLWLEGETVVRAEVLDFKTSKPDADLEQRREHYRPQLEAYREAVAAITQLPPARVTASLFFIEADEYMPIE